MRNYVLVTAGYWAFTLTDGALRMLVLLHFHDLGYSPLSLAFLFLAYEFMGIFTNLLGGWVGSRSGLNRTLLAGLALQVGALVLLTFPSADWFEWVSVVWVMGAQALSGVAKDLTKMSAKSAVKFIAGDGHLFRLVALLTGSKNALKGAGFFGGAALLAGIGYDAALWVMAAMIVAVLVVVALMLDGEIGRSSSKRTIGSVFSKSAAIQRLSLARLFLFASRDIWFVVALPVFLDEELGWSFQATGGFLAAWVIGYGVVQTLAPRLLARWRDDRDDAEIAATCVLALVAVSVVIAILVAVNSSIEIVVLGGLAVFGVVFAVNSSLHSYLILAYSESDDDVALDVGFYYSANAAGRFVGTLASGVLYLVGGFEAALWGTALVALASWVVTLQLPVSAGQRN